MAIIQIKNLSFTYENSYHSIFEDLNLTLDTDWKLGLTARNGKGKTTLLRILSGELLPKGEVKSSLPCYYFPFNGIDDCDTGEDVAKKMDASVQLWQVKRELNLLCAKEELLFITYGSMSKGEQVKLQLAVLFSKEQSFLLIDEPTNHLDALGRAQLSAYLRGKKGFIVASHDSRFMDGCVDHVMALNKSSIEIVKGNLSSYLEQKGRQNENERIINSRKKEEILRLKEAALRADSWAEKLEKTKTGGKLKSGLKPDRGAVGAKSAKMMKRALALVRRAEKSAEEKSKLLKDVEREDKISLFFKEEKSGEVLLSVRDLSVFYGNIVAVKNISFDLFVGERLLLSGQNGSGKTSVLKAILRDTEHFEGSYLGKVTLKNKCSYSYVSQDVNYLQGTMMEYCRRKGIDRTLLTVYLNKMGLEKMQFDLPLQNLSMGSKKKILLAESFISGASLFIWDEPLNFIDIYARRQIKEMIEKHNLTMLFIEHDADFCKGIATRTIEL